MQLTLPVTLVPDSWATSLGMATMFGKLEVSHTVSSPSKTWADRFLDYYFWVRPSRSVSDNCFILSLWNWNSSSMGTRYADLLYLSTNWINVNSTRRSRWLLHSSAAPLGVGYMICSCTQANLLLIRPGLVLNESCGRRLGNGHRMPSRGQRVKMCKIGAVWASDSEANVCWPEQACHVITAGIMLQRRHRMKISDFER
jgi:hypothetical protein